MGDSGGWLVQSEWKIPVRNATLFVNFPSCSDSGTSANSALLRNKLLHRFFLKRTIRCCLFSSVAAGDDIGS